jgi:plasmid stability protein
MRNVTITLDDSTAEWARVFAARHQTSVSHMLGKLLAAKMRQEEGYHAAMESYLAAPPSPLTETPAAQRPYLRRDSLHER